MNKGPVRTQILSWKKNSQKPAGSYILTIILIMLTITSHIFIHIFQTVHFFSSKIPQGYKWGKYGLSFDTKFSESLNLKQSVRTSLRFLETGSLLVILLGEKKKCSHTGIEPVTSCLQDQRYHH